MPGQVGISWGWGGREQGEVLCVCGGGGGGVQGGVMYIRWVVVGGEEAVVEVFCSWMVGGFGGGGGWKVLCMLKWAEICGMGSGTYWKVICVLSVWEGHICGFIYLLASYFHISGAEMMIKCMR